LYRTEVAYKRVAYKKDCELTGWPIINKEK